MGCLTLLTTEILPSVRLSFVEKKFIRLISILSISGCETVLFKGLTFISLRLVQRLPGQTINKILKKIARSLNLTYELSFFLSETNGY